MLRRKLVMALTLAVATSLMLAGSALAKDRNHDRIPDKWEKRHHLSLHHKQGKRDQDKDGLRNRAEFRSRLDPRDADTDDDGTEDGDENTGKVESFEDGVLTISLFNGETIKGAVTDDTEIECDADASDDRGDDQHGDHGDDDQGDGDHGDGDHGDGDHGDDDDDHGGDEGNDDARAAHHGDDDDDEGNEDCGTDALVPGARVLEAELKIRDGEAAWDEVELFTP